MSENDNVTSQAQQHSHGKRRLKRCVLWRLRKTAGSDCADVTCCGILFQTRAAATGKARSSTIDNRVRRMTSDDDEAERSRRQYWAVCVLCSSSITGWAAKSYCASPATSICISFGQARQINILHPQPKWHPLTSSQGDAGMSAWTRFPYHTVDPPDTEIVSFCFVSQ